MLLGILAKIKCRVGGILHCSPLPYDQWHAFAKRTEIGKFLSHPHVGLKTFSNFLSQKAQTVLNRWTLNVQRAMFR